MTHPTAIEIVVFLMPWEIDAYEKQVATLRLASNLLEERHDVRFDATFCLSDRVVDWSCSKPGPDYFAERFEAINATMDWWASKRTAIETGDDVLGCVDKRREHLRRCDEGIGVLWLDSDVVFSPRMLRMIFGAMERIASRHFIITPSLPKMWDDTWSPLVHPAFARWQPGLPEQLGLAIHEAMEKSDGFPDLVELAPIKFGGGWMNVIDAALLKLIDIPDSFASYGREDTFVMRAAQKLQERGYDVRQYLLKNAVVGHDFHYRTQNPYSKSLSLLLDKEKLKRQSVSVFNKELRRCISRIRRDHHRRTQAVYADPGFVASQNGRLHVVHVNAECDFSGGEVQVFLLMEGLQERGHRNMLVCPPASESVRMAAGRRLELKTVAMRSNRDIPAVLRLASRFRRSGADIIHLHTWTATRLGGLAAHIAGKPAIATCRMERRFERSWHTRLTYETLVRRTVAISSNIAESLAARGVRRDRMCVIHSAVAPARVLPGAGRAATRRELGVPLTQPVLLTIGSLIHRKGIDVLLDALAILKTAGVQPLLWIAGEGPERARLVAQVEHLDLVDQVCFLGRRDDVGGLLAAADVFVMPSRSEGLGVAALEAMAASRPVVATRVGGLREAVIDGKTGLLVPPESPAALAAGLEQLVYDPSLRERLGAAGPSRIAEAYLPEPMVAAYEQVYRLVLHEWATRHAQ